MLIIKLNNPDLVKDKLYTIYRNSKLYSTRDDDFLISVEDSNVTLRLNMLMSDFSFESVFFARLEFKNNDVLIQFKFNYYFIFILIFHLFFLVFSLFINFDFFLFLASYSVLISVIFIFKGRKGYRLFVKSVNDFILGLDNGS